MINKSLDDLISEAIRESLMLLEYRFNPEEAYQVLSSYGIDNAQELSVNDLKKVYRKLSAKYHPDAGGTHEDFLKIHAAYEALVDFVTTQKAEAEARKKRAEEQRKREEQRKKEEQKQAERDKAERERMEKERAERERAQKEREDYWKPGGGAEQEYKDRDAASQRARDEVLARGQALIDKEREFPTNYISQARDRIRKVENYLRRKKKR